jgi:hypothetical protein
MFRLLKLKTPHGWNAVAWELAIVTVGVLVALAAQQIVENWEWQRKVSLVRQSILGELANDRARWEFDVAGIPCTLRDLEKLDRWAEQGAAAPVPKTPWFSSVPLFWMHSANWYLATNSQTLDHFPLKEQLDFAALYDGVEHRQIDLEKATDLAERVLSAIPLADDAQSRRELRTRLGELKIKMASLAGNDAYMRRHFDAVGVKPDRGDFAQDLAGPTCPG